MVPSMVSRFLDKLPSEKSIVDGVSAKTGYPEPIAIGIVKAGEGAAV